MKAQSGVRILQYTIGCYGKESYVFTVPLRASEKWLKKVLRRSALINGKLLTRKQLNVLKRRVAKRTEIGWDANLEYVLEAWAEID